MSPRDDAVSEGAMRPLADSLRVMDDWPDRAFLKNKDRQFVYANKAALAAHGCATLQELLGKQDEDFFSLEHASDARSLESEILSGSGGPSQTRLEVETWRDGQLKFVSVTRTSCRAADGTVIGLFGTTRELSVAERLDFLARLAAEHREKPSSTKLSMPTDPSDAGNHWTHKPIRKHPRTTDARWLESKLFGTHASPIGATAKNSDGLFRSIFREPDEQDRFLRVHDDDRSSVFDGLRHVSKHEEVGYSSGNLFFRVDPSRAATGSEPFRWMQANVHIIRISPGISCQITSHRWIDAPFDGDLLGNRFMSAFPGYLFAKGTDGKFVFMNERLRRLLRIGEQDVAKIDDSMITDEQDEIERFRVGDRRVLQDGNWYYGIEQVTLKQPGRRSGSSTAPRSRAEWLTVKLPLPAFPEHVRRSPGSPDRSGDRVAFGIAVDIGADPVFRTLSEAAAIHKELFGHHQAAIYIKERRAEDGKFVYKRVNESFRKLVTDGDEPIEGRTTREVWSRHNPEMVDEMEAQDEAVFNEGGDEYHNKLRATLLPNGNVDFRTTSKMVVRNDQGEKSFILGVSIGLPWYRAGLATDIRLRNDATPFGERNVAIMFCDVRGFSTLAANFRADRHPFSDFYREFFSMFARRAKRHGCVMEKMTGDGALFLTGLSSDDVDPVVATRKLADLAFGLSTDFDRLVDRWHLKNHQFPHLGNVKLASGIHYGEASVGWLVDEVEQRSVFVALGNEVNTAQRIESVAGKQGGLILVSAAVRKLLDNDYRLSRLERYVVKDGSVVAAELLSKRGDDTQDD